MLRERYPVRAKNYEYRCRRIELPRDLRKGKRRCTSPVGEPSFGFVVATAPSRATTGGVSAQANETCTACADGDGHVRKGLCWSRVGRDAI